tara:strand:- start:133 stop:789 length:657 start_codon:yes stop_codon:yes gene_type:complete
MHRIYSFILLSVISLVWLSCKEEEPTIDSETEDRTFEEAMVYYNELRDILIGLTSTQGLTRESNFPTNGTTTYSGVYMAKRTNTNTNTSETELLFVADMTLTLDFSTGNYTGTISNFTTDLLGYDHPEGTAEISGSIRGTAELGGDEFGLSLRIEQTPLTQGGLTANFDGVTSDKGRFYGKSAQYIAIGVQSTFVWTAGPEKGNTTGTSGFVYVMAEE